jgi:RNA polymerase sigma-70 factor (ECF subfamily)
MSDHPDIKSLVADTINGDQKSFCELMRFHTPMVSATVGRFARNESDREDLAQEVFIRAYKSLRSYKASGSFEGWLRKLTVHTCLDWLRKQKRFQNVPLDESDTLPDSEPDQERNVGSSEALRILHDGMKHLSAEDQTVIVLKELECRSIKEISEITGWSESNVKVRAMRAKDRLRKILIGKGEIK